MSNKETPPKLSSMKFQCILTAFVMFILLLYISFSRELHILAFPHCNATTNVKYFTYLSPPIKWVFKNWWINSVFIMTKLPPVVAHAATASSNGTFSVDFQ